MAFYMFQGRYSIAAIKAMVDKPQDREPAVRKVIQSAGGKLHHFFLCFGVEDVVAIVEAPNDRAMAACALAIGASGTLSSGATTKLMTSSEAKAAMSAAKKVRASYKAPA